MGLRLGEGAGDLGETEVCRPVAEPAQGDQAPQRLGVVVLVVLPALMGFQALAVTAARNAAGLAAVTGPPVDHGPKRVPLAFVDAAADVGEPAGRRYEVDEQASAKAAVFPGQQLGYPGLPAREPR